jgi:hypothetical protein
VEDLIGFMIDSGKFACQAWALHESTQGEGRELMCFRCSHRYTRDENSKKLAGEDQWTVERLAP